MLPASPEPGPREAAVECQLPTMAAAVEGLLTAHRLPVEGRGRRITEELEVTAA